MGVKFFFVYIKNNFGKHIKEIKRKENYTNIGKVTDNLLIDMNGVFHNSAQKVYEYGNFKKPPSLLRPKKKPSNKKQQELRFFQDICATIDDLIDTTKPRKRVIMCVDGCAPHAKMCLTGDTLVTMASGISKKIIDILPNEKVLGWNGHGFSSTKNLGLLKQGVKKILKVTFSDGRELKCTSDHLILTYDKDLKIQRWKEAGKLDKDDMIVCMYQTQTTNWFRNPKEGKPVTYSVEQDTNTIPPSFLKLLSIKECGSEEVFDIEVEDYHSFLANGICVHNCQQRSRRFKSVNDNNTSTDEFDTASISVGTKLMDNLSRYIDWYIRKKVSTDPVWQNLEFVYSSYKVSGEGEQSLLAYIRKYGTDEETYTIHGLDADIIMLALVSHRPNFYVLREDLYDGSNKFLNVDISGIREDLLRKMRFDNDAFNSKYVINDFVFLLYLAGNDFLPHIPSIEILENGIDIMIDVYKNVCKDYGHLTRTEGNLVTFVPKTLEAFLGTISQYEKGMLESKMNKKQSFYPDILLEKHCKFVESNYMLNIEKYRNEYLQTKFPEGVTEQQMCHEYIEGLQWVLNYYTSGIPDWNWHYKYFYAPFAYHLARHVSTYKFKKYIFSEPLTPFQQLLCITPPKSGYLLPSPLNQLLTNDESPIKKLFCPDRVELDLAGKRKEWEAIVLVPMIDRQLVKREYYKLIDKVDSKDLHRNKSASVLSYKYDATKKNVFKSYYGDIDECKVQTEVVTL